uniref:hypothetical protein n=1 Tax=Pararhizobium sp. IMCC3301 TaxID=3067904 RepID=UPI0027429A8A|nr:hypothetical protein [Pararhizobium sp. IMCC3301]
MRNLQSALSACPPAVVASSMGCWALEWMILPNMCESTACAQTPALRLTGQIAGMGERADWAGPGAMRA